MKKFGAATAVATVMVTATTLGTGIALAAPSHGTDTKAKEAHVTGDAWVKFPADREYPYRRFIVDVNGNPWKIVDGKLVMGAARGTVRFDHYSPDVAGGPSKHHWGSIKVDYVMATGPVAIVSGINEDPDQEPNMRRANLTFYQSPHGHRFDRMGFSWGVVNPACHQMGTGPAPFSPASAGPDGHWLRGYTVKDAPLPVPATWEGIQPPDNPPNCSFTD